MTWKQSVALFILFSIFGASNAQHRQGERVTEQLHFSAEDDSVQHPSRIPEEAMAILRKEKFVRSVLDDNNLRTEQLPVSWFLASEIHLTAAPNNALLVIANGPLVGGNVVVFWIFEQTPAGMKLVMTAPAHDLILKPQRWHGHKIIELDSMTALVLSTVTLRFNGSEYKEYRSTSREVR